MGVRKQFCLNGHDTFTVGRAHGYCRTCKREYDRERYVANREEILERTRAWKKANPEKTKAQWDRYTESGRQAEASMRYYNKKAEERDQQLREELLNG